MILNTWGFFHGCIGYEPQCLVIRTLPFFFLFLVDSNVMCYQPPYHKCFHLAIIFMFVAPGISLQRRKYMIIALRLIPPRIIAGSVGLYATETYFLADPSTQHSLPHDINFHTNKIMKSDVLQNISFSRPSRDSKPRQSNLQDNHEQ
jgi:hypothetical protein